jgi:hypothetical protein
LKANTVGDFLFDNILSTTIAGTDKYVYQLLVDGTTTAFTTDPVDLTNLDGCGLQLINEASGGSNVTGSWKIEVSNNYFNSKAPSLAQGTNRFPPKWTDITSQFSPTITDPTGSALSQYVQAYPLVARWLRVTFTRASSSGLITITYSGKGNR